MTALQTKATGEVTDGALSMGETSAGGAAALQRGADGMVNVSLFEATAGQPSKMLSTNQVPLPAASFLSRCVSEVTPRSSNGSPFIDTQTR